jgi:aryl-alcohol dehydrogenase-like predicted oxidoreductase
VKVHPIADLQIKYSVASRDPEDAILPAHLTGIGATPYVVLARDCSQPPRSARATTMSTLPFITIALT